MPIDGGDGTASVKLTAADKKQAVAAAKRTMSDPSSNPTTGADLGAGPGAGASKGEAASDGAAADKGSSLQ